MHSHERAVVRINSWTFNRYTVDRVWPIQRDDLNVLTFAGAHCQIQRPNKSVVARADILQVNQEEIEILQHLARGLAMFAVQTVNRYPESRMLVTSPFDHVVLGLAAIAVLRTEERAQLKHLLIFALENFGSVLQFRIDRRGMQERTNAPAAELVWPKVGQMIDGKLDCHLFCCSRSRRPQQFGVIGQLGSIGQPARGTRFMNACHSEPEPRKTARNLTSVRRRAHHMRGPSNPLGMTEGSAGSTYFLSFPNRSL